jgi:GNAT superfamily N-acetyltransferase
MMTTPNIDDLTPAFFVGNAELAAQAAAATTQSFGTFEAVGKKFSVVALGWYVVADAIAKDRAEGGWGDPQDVEASRDERKFCIRFCAVGDDGNVYAVWEIYSPQNDSLVGSKSRTIQVDASWQGKGIGSAFAEVIVSRLGAQWSERFTKAGARLKDRVEASIAQSMSSSSGI